MQTAATIVVLATLAIGALFGAVELVRVLVAS